jgi:hypothetical protein
MDAHPNVGICGAWSRVFGDDIIEFTSRTPVDHASIHATLLCNSAIIHPTVMCRRSLFDRFGLDYGLAVPHAEDYDLWVRAVDCFELANIPEVLLLYRMHPRQISQEFSIEQKKTVWAVRRKMLERLGLNPSEEELVLHDSLCSHEYENTREYRRRANRWISKILFRSRVSAFFLRWAMFMVFSDWWLFLCRLRRGTVLRSFLKKARDRLVRLQ